MLLYRMQKCVVNDMELQTLGIFFLVLFFPLFICLLCPNTPPFHFMLIYNARSPTQSIPFTLQNSFLSIFLFRPLTYFPYFLSSITPSFVSFLCPEHLPPYDHLLSSVTRSLFHSVFPLHFLHVLV